MNLQDVKDACCAALDRKGSSALHDASSLRVDIRFDQSGEVRQVALTPIFEYQIRGRKPPLENFAFAGDPVGQ